MVNIIKITTFANRFSEYFRKIKTRVIMSKVCQVTGKKAVVGNNVSHSKRRTKRKFMANLFTKRYYLQEENRWITLKVSAAGMRNINKNGLASVLKEAKEKGYIIN